jgi:hypothetical protein
MAGVHCAGGLRGRLFKLLQKRRRRPVWVAEQLLILLLTNLLTIALTSERFFHTLLLTWFQIKRVTLYFLDNVFRLHLALKAPQCVLKGFAFLYSNLCQENTPPNAPNRDSFQNTPVWLENHIKSSLFRDCKTTKSVAPRAISRYSVEFTL